jgi:hypothetical protein
MEHEGTYAYMNFCFVRDAVLRALGREALTMCRVHPNS